LAPSSANPYPVASAIEPTVVGLGHIMLVLVIVFVVFALTVHMRMSTCCPAAELSAMPAERAVPA
jgi:biopolymer transport protein ExbD